MGVDTRLTLPGNVRVDDVADVMGVLAGLKPEQYEIDRSGGVFVRVPGVSVQTTSIATMVEIDLKVSGGHTLVDGQPHHTVPYFFENVGGRRLLLPRATPFWIAVCRGLADFFGGSVDYSDCDSRAVDYRVNFKRDAENHPTNGEPWDEFYRRILNLTPLTKGDLRAVAQFASYSIGLD
jgi:hypothetical protein